LTLNTFVNFYECNAACKSVRSKSNRSVQCVKVLRGVRTPEPREITLIKRRGNADELLVDKANRLRSQNETLL
jgi:hypothetical protein